MHLMASIIGCRFQELIGCLTFGGAPGSNVDDSLDGAYLGLFTGVTNFNLNQGMFKLLQLGLHCTNLPSPKKFVFLMFLDDISHFWLAIDNLVFFVNVR